MQIWAKVYFRAVTLKGSSAYTQAQQAACECEGLESPSPANLKMLRNDTARKFIALSVDYADADNDIMPDEWELTHGLDPSDPNDAYADPDGDGLPNMFEFLAQTDPNNPDTDGNGISDYKDVVAARAPGVRYLDDSYSLKVGGQSGLGSVIGTFKLRNISAPDQSGAFRDGRPFPIS